MTDVVAGKVLSVPFEAYRHADFVADLEFAPRDLTGTTVSIEFSGATDLPTATITQAGTRAKIVIPSAVVDAVHSTCRYLITFTDLDGLVYPCLTGTFRVLAS